MNTLEFDNRWFGIKIKLKYNNFFLRFKNPSHYYRCLSQGNWRFFKQSNRIFFKNFDDGFYRSTIDNGSVDIFFILKVHTIDNKNKIIQELIIRMKKLAYGAVDIYSLNQISQMDLYLLKNHLSKPVFKRIIKPKDKNRTSIKTK
jgi:hypothetical protein